MGGIYSKLGAEMVDARAVRRRESRATATDMPSLIDETVAACLSSITFCKQPRSRSTPPQVLRSADAVCFDVDSTVIAKEGIDELAAYLGVGDKVAALTAQAMGGDVPFEVALANRLAVMKPSKRQLDQMMEAHPVESWRTPGILELIGALQAKGKRVFLVSGGFREMSEHHTATAHYHTPSCHKTNRAFLQLHATVIPPAHNYRSMLQ